ncbi:MAG: hypothetical protein GOVbin630_88 [Prokaryotic dsDNA virus sp.]|nr:MAG: hypothetical protein GOVbin630_88 [Prokaryotic dsDNA virus sp.]|tara:strand:+ start:6953 stop:7258 length:306 start_codon:yes stop_codon:yes gene_type:complete
MGRQITDLENYIEEAIKNIRDDRDITSTLLTKIFTEINKAGDSDAHKDLGLIAAKYVETLQRSNEQLVKLTSILSKKTDDGISLSENDKNDLFDVIQGDKK